MGKNQSDKNTNNIQTETVKDGIENAETAESILTGENELPDNSGAEAAEGAASVTPENAPAENVKKVNWKKIAKLIPLFIVIFAFLLSAAATINYITNGAKSEFHADCTDTIMWANASYESGHVYDPDFVYACFLPFGVNIFMQPLISMFGLTMKAHVMGMMCFFIVLTTFMILMFRAMKVSLKGSLLCTATFLALTLSSGKLREIFWGHTIYYTLGILFLVIGGFLFFHIVNLADKCKSLAAENKKTKPTFIRLIATVAITGIFVMFTATDGLSALSIFLLPFIAAICAEYFVNGKNTLMSRKTAIIGGFAVMLGIMMVAGIKLNDFWAGDMTAGYAEANSNYSAMNTWIEHIQHMPLAWFELLGVTEMDGKKLYDAEGVINLLRIFCAILIAVLPVVATCFYKKTGDTKTGRALRYMIWVHWAVSAIVLSGYVFGTLSAANWRITPVLGSAVLLSVLFIYWAITECLETSRVAVVLALPVIWVAFMNSVDTLKMSRDYYSKNYLFGLAEFIEDQGLEYGYATFWNANSLTLVSDSKIKVSDVTIDEGVVHKRLYQSSSKWYESTPEKTKYFLVLNDAEYQDAVNASSPAIQQAENDLHTVVNNIGFHVLVSSQNFV